MTTQVTFHTIQADGVDVFYREAGSPESPAILLLHGYPTSSFMFRNLIPLLASSYHVVVPDLPGFGFSTVPPSRNYKYTFDNLAVTVGAFVDALKLSSYAIYVFDYGAPTGFRLALARPQQVRAIISQNGNAYEEGLSEPTWAPIRKYWNEPTLENRNALQFLLSLDITKWQYVEGTQEPSQVAPEAYHLDYYLLSRPGNGEIQLDLFLDYASNLKLYPQFHEYFRKFTPPTLLVWGKNDKFFLPPGAEAFKKDNPKAEVHFFETGHFALETHHVEIAHTILSFLGKI